MTNKIELPKKYIKDILIESLYQYLNEGDNLEERQVQIEGSIGKKLIDFCKSKGINLVQITVNWNPSDKVNSYLIRLFVDSNEKYVGLLFDNGLNISNSINLQENFFTIGDEADKTLFKLINYIISDPNFVKEIIQNIKEAIQNADENISPNDNIGTSEKNPENEEDPTDNLELQ